VTPAPFCLVGWGELCATEVGFGLRIGGLRLVSGRAVGGGMGARRGWTWGDGSFVEFAYVYS
jgi:hypothetical protein